MRLPIMACSKLLVTHCSKEIAAMVKEGELQCMVKTQLNSNGYKIWKIVC